jgi:hypothetical protein
VLAVDLSKAQSHLNPPHTGPRGAGTIRLIDVIADSAITYHDLEKAA